MKVLHGDCLLELPKLADNSIDAIVTDAPYHLISAKQTAFANTTQMDSPHRRTQKGFMNTEWDGGDIAFRPDVWRECLRVLKPGGYMVAFGGCRTYHRLVCAIEDAGFVIHPMLAWAFGTGFPKATNASKMIDKHLGAEREVVGKRPWTNAKMDAGNGVSGLRQSGSYAGEYESERVSVPITAPGTPQAAQWEGWSYGLQSLKPALEPICMAQKPMIGTGADNILRWGVGAVNIDATRVPTTTQADEEHRQSAWSHHEHSRSFHGQKYRDLSGVQAPAGRWPPNLLHDGSEEVVECFPHSTDGVAVGGKGRSASIYGTRTGGHKHEDQGYGGSGSAARFFPALGYSDDERRVLYCPKASKRDRAGSSHPTVKPIKLMEWLCKLITPPEGTILDPFAGSGTTGQAAMNCGFDCILIEREDAYVADIQRRMGQSDGVF